MDPFFKRWKRRSLTLSVVFFLFSFLTLTAPVWILVGGVIEVFSRRLTPIRFVLFMWTYVAFQCIGIVSAFSFWLARPLIGRQRYLSAHYFLQTWWARACLKVAALLYGLRYDVDGVASVSPGPVIMLVRHVSVGDTLLAAAFAASPQMRLRYVLKKELLFDPCMDIVGQRLPNVFVDRSASSVGESKRVAALAEDLDATSGVLIYPEGTRYTRAKFDAVLAKLIEKNAFNAENLTRVSAYRHVLPPRLGGVSSLLETGERDVVVVAHTGFEVIEKLSDLWRRSFVGKTIHVRFWRIPRASIPEQSDECTRWLLETWSDVDDWIEGAKVKTVVDAA